MSYSVEISRRARKSIARLPAEVRARINQAIQDLVNNPWPPGCVKMEGNEQEWRIRVGHDYRVVYEVIKARLLILIVDAGPRGNIYKKR